MLNQLVAKIKLIHHVGDFRAADLWPLNVGVVRAERIIEQQEEEPSSSSGQAELATPRKLLREAIVNIPIVPPLSEENRQCLENSKERGRECKQNMVRC